MSGSRRAQGSWRGLVHSLDRTKQEDHPRPLLKLFSLQELPPLIRAGNRLPTHPKPSTAKPVQWIPSRIFIIHLFNNYLWSQTCFYLRAFAFAVPSV